MPRETASGALAMSESVVKDAIPKVTIGLPVFNGERFLPLSLNSLLAQTYRDFRIIVCDNASTDRTPDLVRDFTARDDRVQYVRNAENIGLPRNFNRVFSLATDSPYFKWATSDDLCAPEFLERAVAVLDANPSVVLCYARTQIIDEQGANLEPYDDGLHLMQDSARERYIALVTGIGLSHQHQGLMRAAALRRTALHRDHFASDMDFLAELSLHGKFYELGERLFFRRMHPEALSWIRGYSGETQRRAQGFYDPSRSHGIVMQRGRRYAARMSSVVHAPIPLAEKVALVARELRAAVSERDVLLRELGRLLKTGRTRLRAAGSQ